MSDAATTKHLYELACTQSPVLLDNDDGPARRRRRTIMGAVSVTKWICTPHANERLPYMEFSDAVSAFTALFVREEARAQLDIFPVSHPVLFWNLVYHFHVTGSKFYLERHHGNVVLVCGKALARAANQLSEESQDAEEFAQGRRNLVAARKHRRETARRLLANGTLGGQFY